MSDKRKLAGAVSDLHDCVQRIHNHYQNDTAGNLNRADLIAEQVRRADKIAQILWTYPPSYPIRAPNPSQHTPENHHDR